MSKRNYRQPSTTRAQQSHFSQVPSAKIQRSRMDRSHGLKMSFGGEDPGSFNPGNGLTPIFVDEVLPGDSFHMKSTGFSRLATPLHPIMDNLFLDVHYFFVPYRLVWDDWQHFMGERDNPSDNPDDFTVPQQICQTQADEASFYGRLSHYFGLPMVHDGTGGTSTYTVNALPFRAYRLIWNEWYRDENLQDSVDVPRDAGPDPTGNGNVLLPRGKRKDYFTGALPWPQKGDPVQIPVELQGWVSVYGKADNANSAVETLAASDGTYRSSPFIDGVGNVIEEIAAGNGQTGLHSSVTGFDDVSWDDVTNAATINDLRTAFQIQKLLERDARGGTRYTELIQSHFGVTSPDSRLQRPEYLGGGSSRMSINPVANTAGVDGGRAEGDLAGYGTSLNQATWSKSFTEHGVVIGLVSYRADYTYQRGIERMWSRQTRYDFYWPALAHLGEQAILNKEINYRGIDEDEDVFAYQERYGEYRFKPSRVTGVFNSDVNTSIDPWHLAQDFPVDQALPFNEDFIHELPPIERTIAVPTEPFFIADWWFDLVCDRPMPVYSVPGLVDHF